VGVGRDDADHLRHLLLRQKFDLFCHSTRQADFRRVVTGDTKFRTAEPKQELEHYEDAVLPGDAKARFCHCLAELEQVQIGYILQRRLS